MQNRLLRISCVYLFVLAFGGYAVPARAQFVSSPSDSLSFRTEHEIPDNNAQGIPVSSFLVVPGLEIEHTYDNNIFASSSNEESDYITEYNPAIAAISNWNRHEIYVGLAGNFGRYRDKGTENFDNYGGIVSGTYDIAYGTSLSAGYLKSWRDEGRGSFLQNNNRKLGYTEEKKFLSFKRDVSRIKLFADAEFGDTKLREDNDPLLADPDDYDRRRTRELELNAVYETMPGNQFFLTTKYSDADYTMLAGGSRDSDGYDAGLGYRFNNNGTLNGMFFAGYLLRDFDVSADKDLHKPFVGATVNWAITPLTTVSFILDKAFLTATGADAAGVVRLGRTVSVRHAVTQNLILRLFGGIDNYEFVGGTQSFKRESDVDYVGVVAEYDMRAGLKFKAGVDYQEREEGRLINGFDDTKAYVSIVYVH